MWRESYLLPTWAWKITCWRFKWTFQSSSGCTGSLSPTAPGGPIRWSPYSESGGGSAVYTPLQPTSLSSPLSGMHIVVPSVSSPVSVWSPRCRLGRSCSCTPDVLSHPSHIGYHHQWSLFLLLSLVWAAHVGCFLCRWGRIVADKFHRVISYFRYLEYWMFINFTLRALSYKMVHITFKW